MPLNPHSVRRRLEEAAKKWRLSRAARLVLLGAIYASLLFIVFLAVDQWIHLTSTGRWVAAGLLGITLAGGVWQAWRAWRPVISLASVARRIEESSGGCGNVLISAVQFEGTLPEDSPLRAAIYEEMIDPFPLIRWDRVFDWHRLRKLGIGFGGVLALLFMWATVAPSTFVNSTLRILMPASPIRPITRTVIETVVPGNQVIAHGASVQLRVVLARALPSSAWVRFRDVGGAWERALMEHEAGQPVFTVDWNDVKQPLEYEIQAGDAVSEIYRISVRPRTVIRERNAEIISPEYLGSKTEIFENVGILQNVLSGSTVRLTLRFNNRVNELKAVTESNEELVVGLKNFAADNQLRNGAQTTDPGMDWIVNVPTDSAHTIRVAYRDEIDAQGFASIPLTVVADEPPVVSIADPVEGRETAANIGEELTIRFLAEDALGLDLVGLYQSSDEKADAVLVAEWPKLKGARKFGESVTVVVKPLEGQTKAIYRVIARDENSASGRGVGMSEPIVVRLTGAEDTLNQKRLGDEKVGSGLRALTALQLKNLAATREAFVAGDQAVIEPLLERQMKIEGAAIELSEFAGDAGGLFSDAMARFLHREVKDAIILLRDASSVFGDVRVGVLAKAAVVQTSILAQVDGFSSLAARESRYFGVIRLLAEIVELARRQRDLYLDLKSKGEAVASGFFGKQKALADRCEALLVKLDTSVASGNFGDVELQKCLKQVSGLLKQQNSVDQMHSCAQMIQRSEMTSVLSAEEALVSDVAKVVNVIADWQLNAAKDQLNGLQGPLLETVGKFRLLEKVQLDASAKLDPLVQKEALTASDFSLISEVGRTKTLLSEAVAQTVGDALAYPEHSESERIFETSLHVLSEFEMDALNSAPGLRMNPPKLSDTCVERGKAVLDGLKKTAEISAELIKWVSSASEEAFRFVEQASQDPAEQLSQTEDGRRPRLKLHDTFAERIEILAGEAQTVGESIPKPQPQVEKKPTKDGDESNADSVASAPVEQKLIADSSAQVDEKTVFAALVLVDKLRGLLMLARALHIDAGGLRVATVEMERVGQALKEGRVADALAGHERVMQELRGFQTGGARSGMTQGSLGGALRPDQRRTMGGVEGEAPAAYKSMVVEYFRSLSEGK